MAHCSDLAHAQDLWIPVGNSHISALILMVCAVYGGSLAHTGFAQLLHQISHTQVGFHRYAQYVVNVNHTFNCVAQQRESLVMPPLEYFFFSAPFKMAPGCLSQCGQIAKIHLQKGLLFIQKK